MSDPYWIISVEIDGEEVAMVAANEGNGRELTEDERQLVCRAVRNLADFVGCEELEHE